MREFEFAGFDFGKIEDLFDQGGEREPRGAHGVDIAFLFGIEARRDEQFGHAQDAVERRPDLMAHGGEQPRFRFACGLGAGARVFGLFDFQARFKREFLLERGAKPMTQPYTQRRNSASAPKAKASPPPC